MKKYLLVNYTTEEIKGFDDANDAKACWFDLDGFKFSEVDIPKSSEAYVILDKSNEEVLEICISVKEAKGLLFDQIVEGKREQNEFSIVEVQTFLESDIDTVDGNIGEGDEISNKDKYSFYHSNPGNITECLTEWILENYSQNENDGVKREFKKSDVKEYFKTSYSKVTEEINKRLEQGIIKVDKSRNEYYYFVPKHVNNKSE
ncbi:MULTISPECIES: hypothetical protein [Lactococcus]|uniref:hypothetical protein n=1 Tax=Lactococcus TaxID=1357 RepID=UPI002435FD5E|nr:hypothetical protein [Lactococcus formosensis]MDG6143768.1 hypothetical protein [Lactococcus formosensis]